MGPSPAGFFMRYTYCLIAGCRRPLTVTGGVVTCRRRKKASKSSRAIRYRGRPPIVSDTSTAASSPRLIQPRTLSIRTRSSLATSGGVKYGQAGAVVIWRPRWSVACALQSTATSRPRLSGSHCQEDTRWALALHSRGATLGAVSAVGSRPLHPWSEVFLSRPYFPVYAHKKRAGNGDLMPCPLLSESVRFVSAWPLFSGVHFHVSVAYFLDSD